MESDTSEGMADAKREEETGRRRAFGRRTYTRKRRVDRSEILRLSLLRMLHQHRVHGDWGVLVTARPSMVVGMGSRGTGRYCGAQARRGLLHPSGGGIESLGSRGSEAKSKAGSLRSRLPRLPQVP